MAYELDEIKLSQRIFYYLLQHREMQEEQEEELFRAYTEQEAVKNLVKSQAQAAESEIVRYGKVIYLIPEETNEVIGFSKQDLKSSLCRSNATDRDFYLSQFVILTLLVEMYDGQGSTSKTGNYIRAGNLLNCIGDRLKEGARREAEGKEGQETEDFIPFASMLESFEALRSEEKGSRSKTTKEGFLYTILMFLQNQRLITYVEADEMIVTTEKLDRFMDWNLLNKNNFDRVKRVLGEENDE